MMPWISPSTRAARADAPPELPLFVWSVGTSARWSLVLRGELERLRLLLGRYALEACASVVLFAGMFVVFAYLGAVMEGRLSPFGGSPRVLAVLYGVWIVVSTTASGSTSQIAADAAIGMLENLFLAAAPVTRILEMRAIAQALQGTAMAALLLAAFCLGTQWLPSATVLATFVACLAGCALTGLGMALMLSGAALLSKRIGAAMIPVNFLCMLAVMGGPAREAGTALAWTLALPYVAAAAALREALAHDAFAPTQIAIALVGGLPWLLAGRFVLAACVLACRRRGSTHTY